MSDKGQFDELRVRVAKEMQEEADASGKVNKSWETRMRAMSKAVAYNRVLQLMDEIEMSQGKTKS